MSTYLSFVTNKGDHKPISGYFDVQAETIIPERFRGTHASVLRELDRLENDARPNISVSLEQLQFPKISFLEPITQSLTIENTGLVLPTHNSQLT